MRDTNPPVNLVFTVKLRTTAKPGAGQDSVVDRFCEELHLQFGSAVSIELSGVVEGK